MFNVQTINCNQYNSEPVVLNSIIKLGRNHANEINTHTEHLVQKHNDLLWKKKTRGQERKANRIITLDDKNSKKVELSGADPGF